MLSPEVNKLLTRTAPGTPCGELLRRYWQPACFAADLTAAQTMKRVKIMHEDLVVFRDQQGNYGCLAEHCAHRGVSLAYGFVEDCGIRCAYHGWKFRTTDGQCLEQPFEPAGSTYKDRVRQPAYPVQILAGILFVYLGPPPAPLLPRWDMLVWEDGYRKLERFPMLECSWLQAQENSADVTHTYFLHGHTLYSQGHRGRQVDYFHRPFEQYGFQLFEWGLLKSWRYGSGGSPMGSERGGGNPLIFPNILRVMQGPWHGLHWRVPIDDTHTQIIWAGFTRSQGRQTREELENPPIEAVPPAKGPDGEYRMCTFYDHDTMAWETQGALFDRSEEHLSASDRGIVMFRRMLLEQIEIVQRGGEPMALVRDLAQNQIIELPVWVAEEVDVQKVAAGVGDIPLEQPMAEVFDAGHEVFEVPFGAARPKF
jgi:5,5'-dehydrodivanillate O-demethylase oxygenase subunit